MTDWTGVPNYSGYPISGGYAGVPGQGGQGGDLYQPNSIVYPGPTAPAPPTANPSQPSKDQLDARAQIDAYLQQFNLGELSDWAWQQIVNGSTPSQITLQLYDRSSTPGKVVERLYPEVFMRMDKGLPPMSIGEAVTYRSNAIQMMRAANLPPSFYDQPDDLAKFAGNDVSLSELKGRVDAEVNAAVNAPPEVTATLQEWGVPVGSLAAYYLDPERGLPIIQRQFQAAQVAAVAKQTQFGSLNEDQATNLALQGVTADQARQGFAALGAQSELFNALPGEAASSISQSEQLAATFSGDAAARRRIAQRQQSRLADFGGGGGFATGKGGLAGLGSAPT